MSAARIAPFGQSLLKDFLSTVPFAPGGVGLAHIAARNGARQSAVRAVLHELKRRDIVSIAQAQDGARYARVPGKRIPKRTIDDLLRAAKARDAKAAKASAKDSAGVHDARPAARGKYGKPLPQSAVSQALNCGPLTIVRLREALVEAFAKKQIVTARNFVAGLDDLALGDAQAGAIAIEGLRRAADHLERGLERILTQAGAAHDGR